MPTGGEFCSVAVKLKPNLFLWYGILSAKQPATLENLMLQIARATSDLFTAVF